MSPTVVAAPAKVNLFLRVLAREASGYHGIETLFAGLALHDTVRLGENGGPGVTLRVESQEDLGPVERNLAVRAARAYRRRAGLERAPGVELGLEKRIPVGAGLGGGSSDAAAVLRGLDRIHDGRLGPDALLDLAAELGSDVPFFVGSSPLALGWGRGGRLLSLPPLPERPVVLVIPPFRISSASAYQRLDRERSDGEEAGGRARLLDRRDLSSWDGVAAHAANDFEALLFETHPEVRRIRTLLEDAGARPALLSGSGSAVFGVFRREEEANEAAAGIREAGTGAGVIRTRTLSRWPAVRAETKEDEGRAP